MIEQTTLKIAFVGAVTQGEEIEIAGVLRNVSLARYQVMYWLDTIPYSSCGAPGAEKYPAGPGRTTRNRSQY